MRGKEVMQGTTRPLVLVVAVLVLGAIFGGLTSQALARPHGPSPSVLSPRDGQRLPARPALVKFHLGSARLMDARLNGRRMGEDQRGRYAAPCGATRGRICKLRASPSQGLRYGVNRLRVRFKRHHNVRVRKVRFRVTGHRPLAAAGRDFIWTPGSRARLNGRRSLVPPSLRQRLARAGKHAKLRYRWHVTHAPRGGHAKLTRANTPTPRLK